MYSTVVTICTAQWSLYVPPSGHYMYHQFNIQQLYVLPTQLYLCVLCGSQNKQPLFPYITLIDWFSGAFVKLQQATVISFPSLHPPTLPLPTHSAAPTGRIFIKFHVWVSFEKLSRKLKFMSLTADKTNRHFIWNPMNIYDNISLSFSQNQKCFRQNP